MIELTPELVENVKRQFAQCLPRYEKFFGSQERQEHMAKFCLHVDTRKTCVTIQMHTGETCMLHQRDSNPNSVCVRFVDEVFDISDPEGKQGLIDYLHRISMGTEEYHRYLLDTIDHFALFNEDDKVYLMNKRRIEFIKNEILGNKKR